MSDYRDLNADQITALRMAGAKRRARECIARGDVGTYVNGRKVALATLDLLLSQGVNIQKLYEGMQERIDVDPVGFYREVVMPLTSRAVVDSDSLGVDSGVDGVGGVDDEERTVVVLPAKAES